jgi:rRNA maturation RNase YbeY
MSFSMGEGARLEGEVYVNVDRARTQARRYGVSTANEVVRLVVHGTLHLAGYDDRRVRDREQMRAREDFYTERFAGHIRQ